MPTNLKSWLIFKDVSQRLILVSFALRSKMDAALIRNVGTRSNEMANSANSATAAHRSLFLPLTKPRNGSTPTNESQMLRAKVKTTAAKLMIGNINLYHFPFQPPSITNAEQIKNTDIANAANVR